jgi:hypothetical protein
MRMMPKIISIAIVYHKFGGGARAPKKFRCQKFSIIFAFVRSDNTSLYPIDSMEEFIKIKRDVIYSFWKNLENSVIHKEGFLALSFQAI